MKKRRRTRLVTSDFHCLCVHELNRLTNHFRQPKYFPFRNLRTYTGHIELLNRKHEAQRIDLTRTQVTFGLRTWFVCPRCRTRRAKLLSDGLQWYCRPCADAHFESQRQRRRQRLQAKAQRIRRQLGDHKGQIGSPFPPKPYRQTHRTYRHMLNALHRAEHELLTGKTFRKVRRDYRERDREGRYMPTETHGHRNDADDLGL